MTRHGRKAMPSKLGCTRTIACKTCGAIFQGQPDTVNRQVNLHYKVKHSRAEYEEPVLSVAEALALTSNRLRAKQHVEEVTTHTIFSETKSMLLTQH